MQWLTPTNARLALVVEMHLALGPASLVLLVAVLPVVLLGFPHGLGWLAEPISRQDVTVLTLMAALPPAAFALWSFWELGVDTAARARFRFGPRFWLALPAGALSAGLVAEVYGARGWFALAPAWLFVLHMALLQWRLRRVG